MTNFTVTAVPTFRDLQGRFAKAEDALLDIRRDELRQFGRRVVSVMQAEAPKKTGQFASGIRFRTTQEGDAVSLSVSSPQPLGKWIVQGTKPHVITPRGQGYPLRFTVGGTTVFAYRVQHPGTKPNNYPKRAVDQLRPEMSRVLSRISTRFIAKLTGR